MQRKIHSYTYLVALYFLLAPLEDFLTGSFGTLAKYLAILIAVAALVEQGGMIRYKRTTLNRVILYLMLVSILSILWTISRGVTIRRLVAYILVPGITLFIGLLSFNEDEYDLIVKSAILGGLITIVFLYRTGQFSFSSSYYRLTVTEGNDPNNFAALLMLPLVLCFRAPRRKGPGQRAIQILISILLTAAVLLTGSRGGVLSALIVLIVYLLLNRMRKSLLYVLLAGAAFFIFIKYFYQYLPEGLARRLGLERLTYDIQTNEGQRLGIWRHVVFEVLPEVLPFGVGVGCAHYETVPFYGYAKAIHNTYLNMLVETGILGLPAFLIGLYSLFKRLKKTGLLLEASLFVGICAVAFFLDSYAKKFFWNVVMLSLIACSARQNAILAAGEEETPGDEP